MTSEVELANKKKADEEELALNLLALEEDARLKKAALAAALNESHVHFKSSETSSDDWSKICSDYIKQYPDKPIKDNALSFPTKDDAIAFFTTQALSEPPREFLCAEIDQSGTKTGFNVFSCGNKKLYQGSLSDIHNQLKADLAQNPDDAKTKQGLETITRFINPTLGFRTSLQEAKAQPLAKERSIDGDNPITHRPT